VHLPLLLAWLAGYLFSYFALLAIKTRRPARVRPQLVVYATATLVPGVVVVLVSPTVLVFVPAFVVLGAVNVAYAARRRDRALPNDLAFVVQSCLVTFVVPVAAGLPAGPLLGPFVACLLYLVGTVLYVKTMVRERGSAAYRRASTAYHAAAVPAAALVVSAWVGAAFVVFLARAVVLPRRAVGVKAVGVKQVGLLELACSVLLLATLAIG
jgi:hypothetical protein